MQGELLSYLSTLGTLSGGPPRRPGPGEGVPDRSDASACLRLGTQAMAEGRFEEASTQLHKCLGLLPDLHQPNLEAVVQHNLGLLAEIAEDWQEAESRYREAARIRQEEGLIAGGAGAVNTWIRLGAVAARSGNPERAETWYRKAMEEARNAGDQFDLAAALHELAHLLTRQSGRLAEARRLAEEGQAVAGTFDHAVAEIW